jgi:hypothetical protein
MQLLSPVTFFDTISRSGRTCRSVDEFLQESQSEHACYIRLEQYFNYASLAHKICEFAIRESALLYFHEKGIWGHENWLLSRTVMSAFFASNDLDQVMSFSVDEGLHAATLLQLGFESGWGGMLYSDEDNWFAFNHDGFAVLQALKDARPILGKFHGVHMIGNKGQS